MKTLLEKITILYVFQIQFLSQKVSIKTYDFTLSK